MEAEQVVYYYKHIKDNRKERLAVIPVDARISAGSGVNAGACGLFFIPYI